MTVANEAKLDLAADYGLRAKFDYTHDGETRTRRLAVDDYTGDAVQGESYDEHGRPEGYRRFLLDRIVGDVTIR